MMGLFLGLTGIGVGVLMFARDLKRSIKDADEQFDIDCQKMRKRLGESQ